MNIFANVDWQRLLMPFTVTQISVKFYLEEDHTWRVSVLTGP